jgi:hypothetical protein
MRYIGVKDAYDTIGPLLVLVSYLKSLPAIAYVNNRDPDDAPLNWLLQKSWTMQNGVCYIFHGR